MPKKTWPIKTRAGDTPPSADAADLLAARVLATPDTVSAIAMNAAATPGKDALADIASTLLGDSGSSAALDALMEATRYITEVRLLTLLKDALVLVQKSDYETATQKTLEALRINEKCGTAWHILAVCREKAGDIKSAFTCFEAALQLEEDNTGIANDLGRLAYHLDMHEQAEKLFRYVLEKTPDDAEVANNYASCLREVSRFDEAIALLTPFLEKNPANGALWNTLGTVVNAKGDLATALLFFDEAVKFVPNDPKPWHNRGLVLSALGEMDAAIDSLENAIRRMTSPTQIEAAELALAFCYFVKGDLMRGYHFYAARKSLHSLEGMKYVTDIPALDLSQPLTGKSVFVTMEQGLGDEILFGTLLPDLLAELGPDGHLTIGVERRLMPLFARTFPQVHVTYHGTGKVNGIMVRHYPQMDSTRHYDGFIMLGDLLPRYRQDATAFPRQTHFLTPDPQRVAYWKAELDKLGPEPKVGLLWKSLVQHSRRDRYYSPFESWGAILRTPGVHFVNLQYGDVSEELRQAEREGLSIWNPPGIDLKQDLDDLAALCAAMDLIMGPSNATSNIAAAVGTDIWIIAPPHAWTMMGTDHYPWYGSARMFVTPTAGEWGPGLEAMRQALIHEVAAVVSPPSPDDIRRQFQTVERALLMRDWDEAEHQARALIRQAPDHTGAWQALATALDRQDRVPEALDAYQKALTHQPDSLEIAADLAQLAFRMGLYDMAERFYGLIVQRDPGHLMAVNYYAAALREQGKFEQAITLLQAYLTDYPQQSALWDTLGTVLMAQGDAETALIFFNEAVTLDNCLPARFNRACLWMETGRVAEAIPELELCLDRFSEPTNLRSAELMLAYAQLALGNLKAGWTAYAARHMTGTPKEVHFDVPASRLKPEEIAGKRLLVVAEQGLGDEVMLGTLLPDIIERLADGVLTLAVEKRLVPLFARAFPKARVLPHHTETRDGRISRSVPGLSGDSVDGWALLGDFLPLLRSHIAAFAHKTPLLTPDPARVAFWKSELARQGAGRKVGLLWKSLISDSRRQRLYPAFEVFAPLLAQKDTVFVNLQYGETVSEQITARAQGATFYTPTIDLQNDLGELSALCAALDVVIGPANASSQIAAATGAATWLLLTPGSWTTLGSEHYPWYANARTFVAEDGEWGPVVARVVEALK